MFVVRSTSNDRFHFDTVAGRYVVLCFLGSASVPLAQQVHDAFMARRSRFDDVQAAYFPVTLDPQDEAQNRIAHGLPGVRVFWDLDQQVSQRYGCLTEQGLRPTTFLLDERQRVLAVIPFTADAQAHVAQVMQMLDGMPKLGTALAAQVPAPVLVLPRVFEPALCQRLMDYYNEGGAEPSGFMREVNGKTVGMHDQEFKRRQDKTISDPALQQACMARIHDRLVPEVAKAFQFRATRMERHIVACYDSADRAFFRPHRDNTTQGTAHRRFAVSVVLNTGEFEGGQLRFPEFGHQTYHPPAGGAVVFSCSLLHEATPVTHGRRFTYLPFLYDEAAAHIRQANAMHLARASEAT